MKTNLTKTIGLLLLFLMSNCLLYGQKAYDKLSNEVRTYYARLNDKQKIQASEFILSNLKYHYYYNSDVLQRYYAGVDSISKKYKYPANITNYQHLNEEIGALDVNKTLHYDYEIASSKDLINDINTAFELWRNGLWANHLTFEEFCEYLLPYKIGTESPEFSRNEYKNIYMPYANKILQCDERKYSPYWAAISVCDGIKKKNFKLNDKAMSFSEVEIPVSIIDKMNMGQCYQLAKLTTTIMKSCGIPVALDYTPQWPNRSGNHTWNALKDGKGKIVPFIGADTYPGAVGKSQDDMPKVYRYTYAYQANSVWALGKKYNESIPPTLGSPFIRDVSTEYFNGTNINVEVKKTQTQKHIIYLSVYNNQQWIPVTGSELTEEGTVSFANMGRNILYLPVYWGRNGSIPCGNPVYISPSGEKKHFIPNNNKPISVTLTRKYPILGRMYDYAKAMVGGKLEASNTPDFKEAHTLYEITDIPNIWWNEYSLNKNHTEYRYYRFSAPYNCKCNIAEIKFYDTNGNMIEYIPICDDYARNKDRVKNINDNKYLSYYESIHFMKAWAGGDMKTPVAIDKISIMPRNDDNHVVSGHIYKLEYFSDGSLVTVGIKKATNDSITFNNIPSEALMILHDLTAGTEERLFCIENGNTHWF